MNPINTGKGQRNGRQGGRRGRGGSGNPRNIRIDREDESDSGEREPRERRPRRRPRRCRTPNRPVVVQNEYISPRCKFLSFIVSKILFICFEKILRSNKIKKHYF